MEKAIDSLIAELRTDWVLAIENLIQRQEQEQFFVDFKTSSATDYTTLSNLTDNDRKNLYKAISWFGNSEWGVLIWWVEWRDFAAGKKPIRWLAKFVTFLNSSVSRITIPIHTSVENFTIIDGNDEWYVVTIIPKSNHAPHRTVESWKEGNYYMRAGDSFAPVPHSVLAWMFWKRPAPEVQYMYTWAKHKVEGSSVKIEFWVQLFNIGQGIARDLFLNVTTLSHPSNVRISVSMPDNRFTWTSLFDVGFLLNGIDWFRLSPQQRCQPIVLSVFLDEWIYDKNLEFDFLIWSEGSIPVNWKITNTPEELQEVYRKWLVETEHGTTSLFLKSQ